MFARVGDTSRLKVGDVVGISSGDTQLMTACSAENARNPGTLPQGGWHMRLEDRVGYPNRRTVQVQNFTRLQG